NSMTNLGLMITEDCNCFLSWSIVFFPGHVSKSVQDVWIWAGYLTPEEVSDVFDNQDLDLAIDDGHFYTDISDEGSSGNLEFGSPRLMPIYLCLPSKPHLWLNCDDLDANDVVPTNT
nr:hypothetical protein [Tanacetum cinerariifolium]